VDLEQAVEELIPLARQGDEGRIRTKLKEIVPEYELEPSAEPNLAGSKAL
jgi:hypothetical protein